MMSDEELLRIITAVDPETKRIPPGIRAIADAIYAAKQKDSKCLPWNHAWGMWRTTNEVKDNIRAGVIQRRECTRCGKADVNVVWMA